MANTSISNLSAGAAVAATDLLPNVQTVGVGPVKTTAAQLKTFMSASPTLVTPNIGVASGTSLATTGALTTGTQQTAQGSLVLANTAAGAFSTTIQSSNSATTAWTFTLPTSAPAANNSMLLSATTGVTSWSAVNSNVVTFLGTPSSANLAAAVTDETGSGALVFGTSPTFTTSAIFPAGTVTAPAITTTSDTNTGIYFPAADSIGFVEGGVESIRLDSSGNVGINETSPATYGKFAVTGTVGTAYIPAGGNELSFTRNGANYINAPNGQLGYNASVHLFNNGANTTEYGRINSSSNILLGTTSNPTSGTQCFTIETGTAPTASPADTITIYSTDLSAGNTMLSIYTEGTSVNVNATAAATHRIAVRVNGTVYYLLANTSA